MIRVVPMCELRDCGQRADYFWHWGVAPAITWVPVCASCMAGLEESLPDERVAPIAEMAGVVYAGSDHGLPLLADEGV